MDKSKKSPLAEKLIACRKAKEMTQSEIAEVLNIKRSTYAYYERSTMPPVDILRKLARLFGTTVDALVGNKATTYAPHPDAQDELIIFNQDGPSYNSGAPSEKLSGDEKLMLARYQILPPDLKMKVQEYIRNCLDTANK